MKILPKTHPETGPKTGSPSKPYFSWFLTIFDKSGGPNWDHISGKTRPKIRSILGPGLERDWKAMEREKWLGGLSARGWVGFTPPLGEDCLGCSPLAPTKHEYFIFPWILKSFGGKV